MLGGAGGRDSAADVADGGGAPGYRRSPARPGRTARLAGLFLCATAAPALPVRAQGVRAQEAPPPLQDLLGSPDGLTVRVNLHSRTEGIRGQFRPANTSRDFLQSFRTDVAVEYDAGPVRLGAEFRDARGIGQDLGTSAGVAEINSFEPLQAYAAVELNGLAEATPASALLLGRFTMDIGAGRFVARPDFANSVNSYTSAMLDWRNAAQDRLVAFLTLPSTRLPNDAKGLRTDAFRLDRARSAIRFYGGSYARRSLLGTGLLGTIGGEAYAYRLAERDSPDQPTRNRHLLTIGVRLLRPAKARAFDFETEAARQTGRARLTSAVTDRASLPVEAYLFHGEVGRRFAAAWTPRASLHADDASGDDRDPARITRLDSLYGAPRVDFGPTSLYGAINRSNLRSVGFRLKAVPSKRLDGFVMLRALWLDSRTDAFAATGIRDRAGQSGRYAGDQLEGRVRYTVVSKRFRVELGGAVLDKARFLRRAPNAPRTGDTLYGYLDLVADL